MPARAIPVLSQHALFNLPLVELKAAWTEDEAGSAISAFQQGDAIQSVYRADRH